ncbi:type II toxin-antitoxin system Phd/YefM family antitoxin [Deinococcus sp.]|uniref:type II toxin-antitoxin system Phd/YefM family antitoxin n=1 Tax=Deinococcus sp. TaxID=47478 RepID=UPI0025D59C75|nr:type II toxin-antitoxin system Phd/YefM family antitoxin [Deinococcus sp.]
MTIRKSDVPQVWRLEEAKARFSQVVDQAISGQPQRVTRRGKDAVVVVSAVKWDALHGKSLKASELFRNAPRFDDFELDLDRGEEVFPDRVLDLG